MRPISAHRSKRGLFSGRCKAILTLAALALAIPEARIVRAADDAGIHEFLRVEASRAHRPAPPAPRAAPQVVRQVRLPPPKYASLPKAEPEVLKPPRPENKGPYDPVALLMKDPTLRYGDIAIFPDGPKVFRGEPGHAHRRSDFEDLRHSTAVSPATRKVVLAMAGPGRIGLNEEPRRRVTLRERSLGRAGTRAEAKREAVRVIYPAR